jgi:large subunit ribosomal protein L17
MRHGDKINNLGRTAAHRRAMLANMAASLIEHKRISTTLAKAKALRRYVEPLVTKSKDNSTHSRRVVFGYLQSKEAVTELFGPIAEKIGERPGGYLRVIKLGFRRGDGAETALIEFVDFNDVYNPNAGKTKTTKKTRRGSSARKSGDAAETAAVVAAPVAVAAEEVAAEPVIAEAVVEMEATAEAAVAEVETAVEEVNDAVSEATEEATEEKKEDEQA